MVLVFTPTVLCSIPEIKRVANMRIKYNAREDENKKEFSIMVKKKRPIAFVTIALDMSARIQKL